MPDDLPPDAGERPAFAKPAGNDAVDPGDGPGYSGQEYDNAGQRAWRDRDEAHALPRDGEARGSGAGAGGGEGGEDYDDDAAGGSGAEGG